MTRQKLNQKGDTIVEILLSVAVLTFVLAISYGLANSSSQTTRASQERSEAQRLTEEQLELLRGFASNDNPWQATWRCFVFKDTDSNPATPDESTITEVEAECGKGTEGRYNMRITYDPLNNSYTVATVWDNVKGRQDQLSLAYKLPINSDVEGTAPPAGPLSTMSADTNPLPAVPNSGTDVTWTTEASAVYCDATNFNGSARFDPRPSFTGTFNTGPLTAPQDYSIRCFNSSDTAGNKFTLTVEIVAPKVRVVARKIPPNADNTTPSCGNPATQDKGGSTVTLNPGGASETTPDSNSTVLFSDLLPSSDYIAGVTAPSGYSVCAPASQNVTTGAAGSTTTLNFKIRPNCTSTNVFDSWHWHPNYVDRGSWHEHGHWVTWWAHVGPGGYWGRAPYYYPDGHMQVEGDGRTYLYQWPSSPPGVNADWRNRYQWNAVWVVDEYHWHPWVVDEGSWHAHYRDVYSCPG